MTRKSRYSFFLFPSVAVIFPKKKKKKPRSTIGWSNWGGSIVETVPSLCRQSVFSFNRVARAIYHTPNASGASSNG